MVIATKICEIFKLRGNFRIVAHIELCGIRARLAVKCGHGAVYAQHALGKRGNAYRYFIIAQNIRGELVERAVKGLDHAIWIFERNRFYLAVGKALAQF